MILGGNLSPFDQTGGLFFFFLQNEAQTIPQVLISFQGKRLRSVRHLSVHPRLHQRPRLALSGHHDGHGSSACQRGGAGLWGCGKWWHLWLGPHSPVGGGYRWAPQKLRRAAVGARSFVFPGRRAANIITRKSLEGVGLSGS